MNYKFEKLKLNSSFMRFDSIQTKLKVHYQKQFNKLLRSRTINIEFEVNNDFYSDLDIKVSIYKKDKYVAHFYINSLAGQCSTILFNTTCISPTFRNKGIFTNLQIMKENIGNMLGFTYMMQTCIDNSKESDIIKRTSNPIFKGINNRTDNNVVFYIKQIEND